MKWCSNSLARCLAWVAVGRNYVRTGSYAVSLAVNKSVAFVQARGLQRLFILRLNTCCKSEDFVKPSVALLPQPKAEY